jgi:uncharacterized membrane protein
MDCSAFLVGLFLLVVAVLAFVALLHSRANAAALQGLRAEIARLRDEIASLRAPIERPAPRERASWVTPPSPASPAAEAHPAAAAAASAPAAAPAPSAARIPSEVRPPSAVSVPPAGPAPPATSLPSVTPASSAAPTLSAIPALSAAPPPSAAQVPPAGGLGGQGTAPAAPAPVPASSEAAAASVTAVAAASRPARLSFEELVGARLLVWVGAAALALAGAFLVKISFERGWISPPVRVGLGVAFGLALLAGSEGLRRSSGRISEALAAAGIADLFACFLAATNLYRLVPPADGFLLMSLTTAVAVALALRRPPPGTAGARPDRGPGARAPAGSQGVMVALLGLAGGFLTPALIQTEHPSARNLFGYLLLLIGGLLSVARRRRWRWLALAALGAGLLWAAAWLGAMFHGADAAWLSLFLVLLAVGAFLPPAAGAVTGSQPAPETGVKRAGIKLPFSAAGAAEAGGSLDLPPLVAVTATLALLAGTVSRSGYSPGEWAFLELLAAGVLALAWLDPRYLALAWAAAAITAALLASWGGKLEPDDSGRFLATALAAGGLFALSGWAAALAGPPSRRLPPGWLSAPEAAGHPVVAANGAAAPIGPAAATPGPPAPGGAAHRPGVWAALSAAAGVGFFLIAWQGAREAAGLTSESWGGLALAAAALYLAAAVPVARRRRSRAELTPALAALAVAVTALVSLAVPLALRRDSFAAAWALEAAALAWLAGRFCLPVLILLARLLAPVAVIAALLSDAVERARGEPPIWNELLFAYGLPLAALTLAAWLARRAGPLIRGGARAATSPGRLAVELEWEAVAVGLALVTLEVHQLFQPALPAGVPLEAAVTAWPGLAEWAAVASAWLALGQALLRVNRRLDRRSLALGGRLIVLLGLAGALAGPCLAANPLWNHAPVGETPVWNLLVAAYALPAALAVAAAAEVRRQGGRRLPGLAGAITLLLGFVWITLEVRQAFQGSFLDGGSMAGAAERYAYSVAWVLYGVALLLGGIVRRGRVLRYGSLAVMLLAVAKVFLYDTARLSDLYRVLSFLGLGASLLLLGYLYQHFVFREERGRERLDAAP